MIRFLSYMILLLVLMEALFIVPVIASPHKEKLEGCSSTTDDKDSCKKSEKKEGYTTIKINKKYMKHHAMDSGQPAKQGVGPQVPEDP
ncbi:expressed protein [Phakopsora pachyrhizi]|uniref:Expressed protein n=1 Tax=Phakopsora pachyrhizi TaxID=170000 RepID=A0AAV0AZD9_PHAPC|nr:expressed protein [Phakopsora pachyrhizi]